MEDEIILRFLKRAWNSLIRKDKYLLEHNLSERCVAFKYGQYLTQRFNDFDVDEEYNRNVLSENDIKRIFVLNSDEEIIQSYVMPDIIIHKRGTSDHNLCVIEIKKQSAPRNEIEFDCRKLSYYTSNDENNELKYQLGILIVYNIIEPPLFRIFKNGIETD